MTLYEKGINNYQQTMDFCDNHMGKIKSEKNCGKEQEDYDRYAKELIINRLYYSLFQIVHSYISRIDDEKEHNWDRTITRRGIEIISISDRLFNEIRSNTNTSSSEKELIRMALEKMKLFRVMRNKIDYNVIYNLYDFYEDCQDATEIYESISKIGLITC